MPAGNHVSAHIDRVLSPDCQQIVVPPHESLRSPEHQQRAGDQRVLIGFIMLQIDAGCRPIIFAGRVNCLRVAEATHIFRNHFRLES